MLINKIYLCKEILIGVLKRFEKLYGEEALREKCLNTELFLVSIFLYSD